MAAKKGLGRGFESLIPTDLIDDSFNPNSVYDPTAQQDEKVSTEKTLPLSKIKADPNQPRRHFDEAALEELSRSIKEYGVLQPIVVTGKGNTYEIVAGERRFRASKLAGLSDIPVIIRTLTDQAQLEISLIENIQRRDLNSIETATAYAKLRDQFNLTNDQIAARVHKSASAVINTMRLLKLPKEVVALIADGKLTEGQARPLIGQDEAVISSILDKIVKEEWSARAIEQYVVRLKGADKLAQQDGTAMSPREADPLQTAIVDAFKDRLGLKDVTIRSNAKGAGKLTIAFTSQEDLDRIKKLIG